MGWNPATNIRGPQGLQGNTGNTGATGSTGAKGDKGDKGDPGNPATATTNAGDLTSGVLDPARIPNVLHPPITASGTGAYTVDASAGTDWYLTATGNRTLTITNGADGQMLLIDVLASGGARTITINSVTLTTGMVNPFPIASGKVGTIGLRRTNGAWRVLAQSVDS